MTPWSVQFLGAAFSAADARSYLGVSGGGIPDAPVDGKLYGRLNAAWSYINLAAYVPTSRNIATSAPLAGGGNLAGDLTLSIPVATGAQAGYLSAADWTTFNSKVGAAISISTNAPLSGGGDLSANRTLSISQSAVGTDGYLSSADWNTFNNKVDFLMSQVFS